MALLPAFERMLPARAARALARGAPMKVRPVLRAVNMFVTKRLVDCFGSILVMTVLFRRVWKPKIRTAEDHAK